MANFIAGAIPYIGSFGVAAAEATGVASAESIVNAAVVGVVGDYITSGAISLVDKIFGAGTYNKKVEELYELKEKAIMLNNFRSGNYNERQIIQELQKMPKTQVVKEINDFATDLTNQIGENTENSNISKIIEGLKLISPVYAYIGEKMLSKTAELVIPNNPQYLKIAEIYNGDGLWETPVVFQNGQFSMLDETGEPQIWKYPEYNTAKVVIPPLWGTWVGMNSPNNNLPLANNVVEGRQSYLDQLAYLHDLSYKLHGTFNKFGDYQLISRAANKKDNFVMQGEELIADIAINWFSTLGSVMRAIYGDTTSDRRISDLYNIPMGIVVEPIINDLFEDVYAIDLGPEEVDLMKNQAKVQVAPQTTGMVNNYLLNLINNLEIQIV